MRTLLCSLFVGVMTFSTHAFCQNIQNQSHTGSAFLRELAEALNDQHIPNHFEINRAGDAPRNIVINLNKTDNHCQGDFLVRIRGNNPFFGYDYNIANISDTHQLSDRKIIAITLEATSDPIAEIVSTRLEAILSDLYQNGSSFGASTSAASSQNHYAVPVGNTYLLEDIFIRLISGTSLTVSDHASNRTTVDSNFIFSSNLRTRLHRATSQLGLVYSNLFTAISTIQSLPTGERAKDNAGVQAALYAISQVCATQNTISSAPRPITCDETIVPTPTAMLNSRTCR